MRDLFVHILHLSNYQTHPITHHPVSPLFLFQLPCQLYMHTITATTNAINRAGCENWECRLLLILAFNWCHCICHLVFEFAEFTSIPFSCKHEVQTLASYMIQELVHVQRLQDLYRQERSSTGQTQPCPGWWAVAQAFSLQAATLGPLFGNRSRPTQKSKGSFLS